MSNVSNIVATMEEGTVSRAETLKRSADIALALVLESRSVNGDDKLSRIALASYHAQDYQAALDLLKGIYYREKSPEFAARIAMTYVRMGKVSEAVSWSELAVAQDPRGTFRAMALDADISYLGLHSFILFSIGRIPAAKAYAESCVESFPNDFMGHRALGGVHLVNGKLDDASASLESAMNSAPDGARQDIARDIGVVNDAIAAGIKFEPGAITFGKYGAQWPG